MCVVGYGRPLELVDLPRPSPPPGCALVEVLACGLCFSDVKTIRGHMPYSARLELPHVPGHEVSGRVVEVNGESQLRPGQRVIVYHLWACHRCASCRRGEENLCQDLVGWMGFTHPGGFQEYVVAPVEDLLPVPESVPPLAAPALTCAMGTAYRAVATRGAVRPGERVVVIGLGGVGVHAAQIARVCGARVLGVDVSEPKLVAARQAGLEDLAVVDDLEARVREFTGGEGADVVVETTGVPGLLERARAAGRPGARVVGVGYRVGELAAVLSDQWVLWEYTLLGSRYASRAEMGRVVRLVAEGLVSPVIGAVLPLEEANRAVDTLEAGQATGRLVLAVHPDLQ
jgi:D-arabinose 1-dehydrogenase-like Zn-dependent alcohol dehydrogenase